MSLEDSQESSFELIFDVDDCAAAYRFHVGRQWRLGHYVLMGLIFAGLLFALFVAKRDHLTASDLLFTGAFAMAVGAALVGAMILSNRRIKGEDIREMVREYNREGAVCRYTFDSEKLRIEDRLAGGEMDWKEAYGWAETPELVMIYRTRDFYYFIAKRQIEADMVAKLIAVMQAAGVRQLNRSAHS